jgi:hypothetical protein
VSATVDNEPGRKDRIKIGYAKDGTAIYARNPVGKIGEEFIGYMTGPLDMMRKKQGTIARPLWQIMSNDAGFGRKVYDPTPTPRQIPAGTSGPDRGKHLAKSQLPEGQITRVFGPREGRGRRQGQRAAGVRPVRRRDVLQGRAGRPRRRRDVRLQGPARVSVNQALPDIRKQILRGDIDGAIGRMTELDIPQGLQRFYIKTTLNPATADEPAGRQDFYLHATAERRASWPIMPPPRRPLAATPT